MTVETRVRDELGALVGAPETPRAVLSRDEAARRGIIRPPAPTAFSDDQDFCAAPDLAAVGARLIDQHAPFAHLGAARIVYLWKKKGGSGKGKPTVGKCQKPSGMLSYFANADFVVWVAADHVRDQELLAREIEAVVFHELCHAGYTVDEDTGDLSWVVWPHDVETFAAEIERYGLWQADLRRVGETIRQLRLEEAA